MKDYDGPDIDWSGYNQQFMSAQLAKSVGFFSYLDKKIDAMHKDIKNGANIIIISIVMIFAIEIIILYYFYRPHFKVYFGKTTPRSGSHTS